MRIVFLGTPETAVPALDALLAAGHAVALVITQPDRPAGRSLAPHSPPVKRFAAAHSIPVMQPEKVRTREFLESVRAARPDALAVVAYGRLLPRPVLDAAAHGAINVHFSLLPAYRGAAPVPWALAHGETETGVTTFRLDDGLDTGEILVQRAAAIEPGEHAPALLDRLARMGAGMLVETLSGLEAGSLRGVSQDAARASYAPVLSRADGAWSPAWTAAHLEGRVRGFDPWPGVVAARSGVRLRIVEARARAGDASDAPPGTVIDLAEGALRVACAAGTVASVAALQPAGRRALSAREALNGRHLAPGDRLEPPEPAS